MESQCFPPECSGPQTQQMDERKPSLHPYGPLEPRGYPYPQQSSSPSHHALKWWPPMSTATLIPCKLDLVSGSSSMADKRKANSNASCCLHDCKHKELELLLQCLKVQQDKINFLIQQRNHYRSERDKFRDHLSCLMCPNQFPLRPPSPQQLKSST